MKIAKNAFVALDYTLTLDSGEVVDQSDAGEPLTFIFGAGQMIPGLERQIEGMEAGQTAKLSVSADEGYGEARPELFQDVPRDRFPEDLDIQPGMRFQAQGPHGPLPMVVHAVEGDMVTVDLNHPLAGKTLHFDVKIAEVREATEEELALLMMGGCGGGSCGSCSCH